mgnify:CR=1 FL=1
MCGIMGYVGDRSAQNIIYAGLQRLEYRGYDSAGIALLGESVETIKTVGDTSNLNRAQLNKTSTVGIGHTRWATHGKPTEVNAHPHTFGEVTLVHNGIIENYEELKLQIDADKLKSQTDSEVLAALIDHNFAKKSNLLEAVKQALLEVRGTFGIAVISPRAPGQIIVARRGSPIVIGVGEGQYYIASDSAAIIDHTDKVIYLEDDQIALVAKDALELYDLKLNQQSVAVEQIEKNAQVLDKTGFSSHLEKEIYEQPISLRNAMRGRVGSDGSIVLGGPNLTLEDIVRLKHILIIGCGTAYYAGFYAKYELERMLGITVSVEHASEFRYRHGAVNSDETLAIFMSQSGETADTLASLREAKRRSIKAIGIINTVGSTIAREVSHGGIYLHAGVESSVASTKAYSSMVVALLMLGGYIAYKSGKDGAITRGVAQQLLALPKEVELTLQLQPQIEKIARKVWKFHDWFFLGRGALYPVALEGALKLTEVSYVHAQAFPTGEMKHGPLALISEKHLSVVLLPEDELLYKKSLSSIEEIKARGGKVLTVSTRAKPATSDFHLELAHTGSYTDGLLYNTCLQLLTLAVASKKDLNIDRPRNLAKSVTVE